MVMNDASFILSFVILMAKIWIFGFSPGVCPTEPSNLVFSLGCLVSNGRRALLGGIRLDGSATATVVQGWGAACAAVAGGIQRVAGQVGAVIAAF